MLVGVPTEVKVHEYRVALTPSGVHALVAAGHDVVIQAGAGVGSAISDDDFAAAGARIAADARVVWQSADLICKVKEPAAEEYEYLRPGLIVFAYLHLAADLEATRALLDSGTTSVAYETVRSPDGALPLLAPMSEIAGRLATQVGAVQLLRPAGGTGVLMGGVPGTAPARVVILGAGAVGRNAAQIASGMRADVRVLDISLPALRVVDVELNGAVRTCVSNPMDVEREVLEADLVIGSVLVPGGRTPELVSNDLVSRMRPGSVLVDVAVDQGGCFEDSYPTTHENPTYKVHGSTFYTVGNMPGAVPVTSTHALTNATLPYLVALADVASEVSGDDDPAKFIDALVAEPESREEMLVNGLRCGLSTHRGRLVSRAVGLAHDLAPEPLDPPAQSH